MSWPAAKAGTLPCGFGHSEKGSGFTI
jgi:hypothetical protein